MRILLGIIIVGFGYLFQVENDQQAVSVNIPFWGKTGPLSIGTIAIVSAFSGILLCGVFSLLKKVRNRITYIRSLSGSPSSNTDLGHHG